MLLNTSVLPKPDSVAQSVTCLATDSSLTADPGVASSIPARYHTFVEIDHEIISTVILLPSAESCKKGCCQLQAKVCARSTGKLLVHACPGKSVVRWTDRPAMTIAVDLGRKATKQTKTNTSQVELHTVSFIHGLSIYEIKRILKPSRTADTSFHWLCQQWLAKFSPGQVDIMILLCWRTVKSRLNLM